VSLERGEDVQDTLGAGRLALALLRVEREPIELLARHSRPHFALQERVDEERDEVEEEERLPTFRAFGKAFALEKIMHTHY
jgi:hypothetical protein